MDFGLIAKDLARGRRSREFLFNFLYVPQDLYGRLARFPDQPSPPPQEGMEIDHVDPNPDLEQNPLPEPVPVPEPVPMPVPEPVPIMPEPAAAPEPEQVQDPDPDEGNAIDQLPDPPAPPPPPSPPPPPPLPLVDRRTLQRRVPVGGRNHHRERFCRARVVRDDTLQDNPRRRPRNRPL